MADLHVYKQGSTHTHTHTHHFTGGNNFFSVVRENFDIEPQVIHGATESAAIFECSQQLEACVAHYLPLHEFSLLYTYIQDCKKWQENVIRKEKALHKTEEKQQNGFRLPYICVCVACKCHDQNSSNRYLYTQDDEICTRGLRMAGRGWDGSTP